MPIEIDFNTILSKIGPDKDDKHWRQLALLILRHRVLNYIQEKESHSEIADAVSSMLWFAYAAIVIPMRKVKQKTHSQRTNQAKKLLGHINTILQSSELNPKIKDLEEQLKILKTTLTKGDSKDLLSYLNCLLYVLPSLNPTAQADQPSPLLPNSITVDLTDILALLPTDALSIDKKSEVTTTLNLLPLLLTLIDEHIKAPLPDKARLNAIIDALRLTHNSDPDTSTDDESGLTNAITAFNPTPLQQRTPSPTDSPKKLTVSIPEDLLTKAVTSPKKANNLMSPPRPAPNSTNVTQKTASNAFDHCIQSLSDASAASKPYLQALKLIYLQHKQLQALLEQSPTSSPSASDDGQRDSNGQNFFASTEKDESGGSSDSPVWFFSASP